jgi:hypothetical protein
MLGVPTGWPSLTETLQPGNSLEGMATPYEIR